MRRTLFLLASIQVALIALVLMVRMFVYPDWNSSIWLLWIPLLLPPLPLWLILGPAMKSQQRQGFLLMLAWLVSGFSLHYTVEAYESSSGTTLELQSVSGIRLPPEAKYFKVSTFGVDTSRAVYDAWIRRGGKYDQYLLIDLYYAVPFADAPGYWYCLSFHKEIKADDGERETQLATFASECNDKLRAYPWFDLYCFKMYDSEELRYYYGAIKKTGATSAVFLDPVREHPGEGMAAGIWLALLVTAGGLSAFALALFASRFSNPSA